MSIGPSVCLLPTFGLPLLSNFGFGLQFGCTIFSGSLFEVTLSYQSKFLVEFYESDEIE